MPNGNAAARWGRQGGFTLIAVLAALVILSLLTNGVMWIMSTQAQRDRELTLLRVGVEIRESIGRYVESSPGTVQTWPPNLEALLDDQRSISLRRHLRRLYADPINADSEWGLIRAPDGGIAGVYSQSSMKPIREGGAELASFGVAPAARYSDWMFVYEKNKTSEGI